MKGTSLAKHRGETIKGIVVKAFPCGDADLILKVISAPGGKRSLFATKARKSKRRFGFGIELFDYGFFEISHGHGALANVKNFSPRKSFKDLRNSLTRLTAATILAESFDALVNEDDDSGTHLLDLLTSSLEKIESSSEPSLILRTTYLCLTSLLVQIGIKDINAIPPASAKHLMAILDEVEAYSERKLLTKSALRDIINDLRRPTGDQNEETALTVSI